MVSLNSDLLKTSKTGTVSNFHRLSNSADFRKMSTKKTAKYRKFQGKIFKNGENHESSKIRVSQFQTLKNAKCQIRNSTSADRPLNCIL